MKKVVISIINYNRADITKKCLKSLNEINQDTLDLEVLIIDNASKEPLVLDLKAYPKIKLKPHFSKVNTGFSGGHNIGFAYAKEIEADYCIILNNDTTVHGDLVQELVKMGETDEKIGIIAPKIYFSKGSEFHKDRYKQSELGKVIWYAGGIIDWENAYWKHHGVDEVDHDQFNTPGETDYASGCCFAVKTGVLKRVGGFDDDYFLYYEDSDFNERVKRSGYKVQYCPKAYMWHQNAGSTGGSGSPLQDYFTTRNRMLIGFRYATMRTKLALLRESLRILKNGREWQKKGERDFYLRKFGKGSYPL